jgi:hypothetical protein
MGPHRSRDQRPPAPAGRSSLGFGQSRLETQAENGLGPVGGDDQFDGGENLTHSSRSIFVASVMSIVLAVIRARGLIGGLAPVV